VPYLPDLDRTLTAGLRVDSGETAYVIEPYDLGMVVSPTGHIVGCDPLVSHDRPFTETVPPGNYLLRAWIAVLHHHGTETQRRIAALQLVVHDTPAHSWTMALTADQDPTTLGDDEFFGYGVDAGTGTLADVTAIAALAAWDHDAVDETFIPAQIPRDPIEAVISAVTDAATGANVFVVGSGWGDGVYPTYIGHTADGQVTSFVTDFNVLPASDEHHDGGTDTGADA
jgi:hypothetical protein